MADVDPSLSRAEEKIEEFNDELFRLKRAEAKEKRADAGTRVDEAVSDYERRRAALEKSLKDLQSAGEHAMKDEQKKIDNALDELDAALEL
ncbi:putative nucleic acid-binding Zn-ribbon protein [Methanolinea mesophila]|uniref:hypothetical protein n=1 Tax=Methanolinea mesophila TaxID=547055 RepID=UPI001AEB6703|nr:hypothetical protein [Methanolinea mesophila]MBP1929784.1 putative nucleic acid-binding Zn-ribbon protein [Methanolinea mesophila]